MKNIHRSLVIGCSMLALSACGPQDVASPGEGGNVVINFPPAPPPPPPPPPPTPTPSSTAAAGCPTIADPQGLSDKGIISGPTGTWRVCELPALVKVSSTLPKIAGLLYSMNGRVNVGCDGGFVAPTGGAPYTSTTIGCTSALTADSNVTLTISPGVILFGNTGQSWLAVNRGNKINATGNATTPIIFTSRDNVLGLNSDTSQGQWGGVVLLGRGPVTDCNVGTVAGGTCERDTEGSADLARFGGADATYNAGTMKFVQIRYSGFVLGANKELQALTLESIGTGTTIDHIQSHNSSDDGMEIFGGAVNFKYYIATGADDDNIDVDTGSQTNIQFALLLPRSGRGDALFEIDSNGAETDTPRTKLQVSNFVAIQPATSADNEANDVAATLFRGNSDTSLANGIILAPSNECIRMNGSGATPATLLARSVVMTCGATKYVNSGTGVDAAVSFGAAANNNSDSYTATLTNMFVNGATETGRTAFDASTWNVFFTATTYIGAVQNSTDTWFGGWTCNTTAVNFGTGNSGNCTSLPIG